MDEAEKEERVGRRVRRASRVMAYVFSAWLAAQIFGDRLGLPSELIPLFDFAAILAFVWALFELWGILRLINRK